MHVESVFYGLVLIAAAIITIKSADDLNESVTQATVFLCFVIGLGLLVVGFAEHLERVFGG